VSSPVRKGGVDALICLSAEGAPRFVSALRALRILEVQFPALTDGAINFRSFGPKACHVQTKQVPDEPEI